MVARSNPHEVNQIPGVGAGKGRYLVINSTDPAKKGRVQVREIGNMDHQLDDTKCPWFQVGGSGSLAGCQQAAGSHGLVPGSMVSADRTGSQGMDGTITHTLPKEEDAQLTQPQPAKESQHKSHTADSHEDQTYGWHTTVDRIYGSTTTAEALQTRDSAGRIGKLTAEPWSESRDKCKIPKHYPNRRAQAKYGGSQGTGSSGTGQTA